MREYIFEEEWADNIDRRFMYVWCKTSGKIPFRVLIDTYDDPYLEYYDTHRFNSDNEQERFRKQLFDYLEKKYPDYF